MPFKEPEPDAKPLLVGELMPPLLPPAFEVMTLRVTMLTSPGSVVLGWFLVNLSRSFLSRRAARSSRLASRPLLDALTRGSTGTGGVGTLLTGAFSSGFSGFGGGGGGGGGGGSMTSCTTRSGSESVFVTISWRGRKAIKIAINRKAIAKFRRMTRKR